MFCCKRPRRYKRIETIDTEFIIEREHFSPKPTVVSPIVKLAFAPSGEKWMTQLHSAPSSLMRFSNCFDRPACATFTVDDEHWTLLIAQESFLSENFRFDICGRPCGTWIDFKNHILALSRRNAQVSDSRTYDYSRERASKVVEALNTCMPSVLKQLETDAADWARYKATELQYESRISIVRYETRAKFATLPGWLTTYDWNKLAFEFRGEIWFLENSGSCNIDPKNCLVQWRFTRDDFSAPEDFENILVAINQAIPEWKRAHKQKKAERKQKFEAAQEKEKKEIQERLAIRRAKFEAYGAAVEKWPKDDDGN